VGQTIDVRFGQRRDCILNRDGYGRDHFIITDQTILIQACMARGAFTLTVVMVSLETLTYI